MSNAEEFRIEWDLHELGRKPAPRSLHGPTNSAKRDFALALAAGDVPANAAQIEEDKAA